VYSAVRIRSLHGRDLTKEAFHQTFKELKAGIEAEDVFVFLLSGPGAADEGGNFRFYLSGDSEALGNRELAEALLSLKTQKIVVLLNISSPQKNIEMETAFLRLKDWLGPGAFVGASNFPRDNGARENGESSAAFTQALLEAAAWAGNSRFLGAAEFSGVVQKTLAVPGGAGALVAFPPAEDFPLIDRYYASGELRMQTMFSGAVVGETQTRPLPSFGVNISELNPANYKKTDILEQMDLPPHYAAFLSGEQLYRSEDYDKAIAEYTRSISLKSDYTEAFVSRGNAWRRKGDVDRAVADYTRAIALKPDYAEVYNYRGYLYARQGNHAKAIEDYSRAVRLKSGYADAWFNRAYAYMETKDWEKAITDYTQVIKLEPSNAAAYKERAFAWSSKGDAAKAEADYAAAAAIR
jgi:cytochrome c-type biogenesis protein CcmH/NrfG